MEGFRPASALVRSVSALAVASFLVAPSIASGQEAGSNDEEIVITGVRASLERAMEIKRNAIGVVDAVSAEDIGKFPDTNLAESLQRIPGVSIDRVNGEGARVTVRGFGPSFNLVTVNGRQIATSFVDAVGGDGDVDFNRATSRSFDFGNLAPEGVSRLEVYKTGRASIPSGGIGAAINVVTTRPLDAPGSGLRGSIGAKALHDVSNEGFKINPEVSGVVNWSDDSDTVGISLFGSYQKRDAAAASATSNSWNIAPFSSMPGRGPNTVITNAPASPDTLVAIPNDSRYHYSESERERINLSTVLQFKPTDGITITADGLFAQNKQNEARSDQTNWFNRPFDAVTFDQNPVVATAVLLSEGSGYATKDIGFEQQYRATKSRLISYGLNTEFEISDTLKLTLDGNHSKSKTTPDSANGASSTLVSFGAPVVDAHSVDYSGPVPNQRWTLNDGVNGNNNGQLDIGDLGTQVQRTNASRQDHRINQLRAELDWDFGGGARFAVGTSYIDSLMTSQRKQTQQTLGDWGITRVGDVQQIAGSLIETYCLECKFSKYSVTDAAVAFRGNAVDLYNAFAPVYSARGNPINTTGDDFDQVGEKVWAAYAQLGWEGEIGGRKAGINAGVRWENTKVTSTSIIALPTAIVWNADNDFSRIVGTVTQPNTLTGEYNNLLPSIDFQIEPMDNVKARVSYSKTLARADYNFLFASQSVNAPPRPTALDGVATGATGSPGLLPLVSDNFDISLEWYFDRSSYVSAAFFTKKVKNFVGIGQVEQPLFGLRDPSSGASGTRSGAALAALQGAGITVSDVSLFTLTALIDQNNGAVAPALAQLQANISNGNLNQNFVDQILAARDVVANSTDPLFNFSVSTPINNRSANIYGFELQGQYFLGDTGFGISGSLTKVYGDVDVDVGADPTVNVFALVGISDSYNITGIYDKDGISFRAAYNWRGKTLAGVNRSSSRNPVFLEPFGTLDLSASYDLNDNLSFTAEAVNVLSESVRSYGRDEKQVFFAQELKPRYLVGVRYKF